MIFSIEALYFMLGNEELPLASYKHAASTLQARNIPLHALPPICHCRRDVLSESRDQVHTTRCHPQGKQDRKTDGRRVK